MLTIARLFGKSPFAPLQTHMNRVASCMEKLSEIFQIVFQNDLAAIQKLSQELSRLEHEADLTKNDIRNHLPKSLFLPIDRAHFLDILSIQDTIADKAEDIGILLSLKPLELLEGVHSDLLLFFHANADVFWSSRQIIKELDELLESSFGGIEAEKVRSMVEQTASKEYEAEKLRRAILQKTLLKGDALSHSSFYLWLKTIEEVGEIATLSERLANRIRMVLELK